MADEDVQNTLAELSRDLRESKARLEEAQRVAHVGHWEWDPGTDVVVWSDETYRIFGLNPQERPMDLATVQAMVHPEDRESLYRGVDEDLVAGVRPDAEFRIVRPNGEVRTVHCVTPRRWISMPGDAKRDVSGRPRKLFGIVQDISERKQAEDTIRGQEAELRQILESAPQLVGVLGPNRERIFINRIALDYLGITFDEWRQKGLAPQVHSDDSMRFRSNADSILSNRAPSEFEMRLRKADASYRWFLARYNPVCDSKGKVMRWYVACTDIEDRKQGEDRLQRENVALREEIDKTSMFEEIVGTSAALKTVLSHISKVAPSNSTVLITGETGTGKELVARAIHRRSGRALRPFVSVNCAAIPRDLVASELFGHEKGAFTGATQQRLGRFELANRGTIFLDEIGELPIEPRSRSCVCCKSASSNVSVALVASTPMFASSRPQTETCRLPSAADRSAKICFTA